MKVKPISWPDFEHAKFKRIGNEIQITVPYKQNAVMYYEEYPFGIFKFCVVKQITVYENKK